MFKKDNKKNETESKLDPYDEVKKLKELLDIGAITEEEFEKKKKEIKSSR